MAKPFPDVLLRAAALAAAVFFAVPAAAQGQAYTTAAVNLRAGPDADYPIVTWLPQGTQVHVYGCVEDYRWCDVATAVERGWVYASYLAYPYQSQPVPIIRYGAMIGLPIITFSILSYWDSHYRHRPWYSQRPRWEHRPPPRPPAVRPPRPPAVQPPRPPIGQPGRPQPGTRPPQVRPPSHGSGATPRPPSTRPPANRPGTPSTPPSMSRPQTKPMPAPGGNVARPGGPPSRPGTPPQSGNRGPGQRER